MARKKAQPQAPDRKPNSVISERATVEACRRDYQAGSDGRAAMARAAQAARARRS
ncbi:hypothetical protein C5F59_027570 [Streptomyces sp. QL37]|uniref:hypothetical protein n=1 Tax=Streptomyces sp. QL37 TaxID=2093747 RepID=UPI001374C45F|nr:hypothetical protein [Streptomyces sp. QL37]